MGKHDRRRLLQRYGPLPGHPRDVLVFQSVVGRDDLHLEGDVVPLEGGLGRRGGHVPGDGDVGGALLARLPRRLVLSRPAHVGGQVLDQVGVRLGVLLLRIFLDDVDVLLPPGGQPPLLTVGSGFARRRSCSGGGCSSWAACSGSRGRSL